MNTVRVYTLGGLVFILALSYMTLYVIIFLLIIGSSTKGPYFGQVNGLKGFLGSQVCGGRSANLYLRSARHLAQIGTITELAPYASRSICTPRKINSSLVRVASLLLSTNLFCISGWSCCVERSQWIFRVLLKPASLKMSI